MAVELEVFQKVLANLLDWQSDADTLWTYCTVIYGKAGMTLTEEFAMIDWANGRLRYECGILGLYDDNDCALCEYDVHREEYIVGNANLPAGHTFVSTAYEIARKKDGDDWDKVSNLLEKALNLMDRSELCNG